MRLGYVQDHYDARDRKLGERIAASTATLLNHADKLAAAYDLHLEQHAQSCVGFATAMGLYAAWKHAGVDQAELPSPGFIWYNARLLDGNQARDVGCTIRGAFKQLTKVGYCRERDWLTLAGYDARSFAKRPALAAYQRAHDQQLAQLEYVRVDGFGTTLIDQWRLMLGMGRPIVFGIPVTRDYLALGPHDAYRGSRGTVVGGHAQCALGFDERGPYGPGTWGDEWGNRGWWHLDWEWLVRNQMDAWALVAPPYYSA